MSRNPNKEKYLKKISVITNTDGVLVKLRTLRANIVAVEKQAVVHIVSVCL
jgi:hypothetical protein